MDGRRAMIDYQNDPDIAIDAEELFKRLDA